MQANTYYLHLCMYNNACTYIRIHALSILKLTWKEFGHVFIADFIFNFKGQCAITTLELYSIYTKVYA